MDCDRAADISAQAALHMLKCGEYRSMISLLSCTISSSPIISATFASHWLIFPNSLFHPARGLATDTHKLPPLVFCALRQQGLGLIDSSVLCFAIRVRVKVRIMVRVSMVIVLGVLFVMMYLQCVDKTRSCAHYFARTLGVRKERDGGADEDVIPYSTEKDLV